MLIALIAWIISFRLKLLTKLTGKGMPGEMEDNGKMMLLAKLEKTHARSKKLLNACMK